MNCWSSQRWSNMVNPSGFKYSNIGECLWHMPRHLLARFFRGWYSSVRNLRSPFDWPDKTGLCPKYAVGRTLLALRNCPHAHNVGKERVCGYLELAYHLWEQNVEEGRLKDWNMRHIMRIVSRISIGGEEGHFRCETLTHPRGFLCLFSVLFSFPAATLDRAHSFQLLPKPGGWIRDQDLYL